MSCEVSAVVAIEATIAGEQRRDIVEASRLAVHYIREEVGLRGTHVGCDTGTCGACTVVIDGQPMKSCMMLAAQLDGCVVETVEVVATAEGELDDLQRAFNEHHALQCGYCTPGMIMSARALLDENPSPTEHEIRRALKGNLCRCTGYMNIVEAISATAVERARHAS